MRSKARSGFMLVLPLVLFACREDRHELRTNAGIAEDGRSYVTAQVFLGRERVYQHPDMEMIPGDGSGSVSRNDDGPDVRIFAEFDEAGRGALVTLHVTKDENVLAHATQFVERPAPAGYVRAGPWNGSVAPLAFDGHLPAYPEKARRNRRQGVLYVEALINAHGSVDRTVVLNPGPEWDGLDAAAAAAVRGWAH